MKWVCNWLMKWKCFSLMDNTPASMSWWRRIEDVFRLRLQKTSLRRLQDVLVKNNIFALAMHLQDVFKTSCQNVFKTSSRRLQDVSKMSSRRLQEIFKTPCQDVFKTSCKNVFKTSSRSLQYILKSSSKRLQEIFKTPCKDIFETFSRHIIKLNCYC